MPTVCDFPKEFFADRAEVAPLLTRGVEQPLADFPPAAVEGKVFVDCHVIAFSADCNLFLAGPPPIAAIPQQTWVHVK